MSVCKKESDLLTGERGTPVDKSSVVVAESSTQQPTLLLPRSSTQSPEGARLARPQLLLPDASSSSRGSPLTSGLSFGTWNIFLRPSASSAASRSAWQRWIPSVSTIPMHPEVCQLVYPQANLAHHLQLVCCWWRYKAFGWAFGCRGGGWACASGCRRCLSCIPRTSWWCAVFTRGRCGEFRIRCSQWSVSKTRESPFGWPGWAPLAHFHRPFIGPTWPPSPFVGRKGRPGQSSWSLPSFSRGRVRWWGCGIVRKPGGQICPNPGIGIGARHWTTGPDHHHQLRSRWWRRGHRHTRCVSGPTSPSLVPGIGRMQTLSWVPGAACSVVRIPQSTWGSLLESARCHREHLWSVQVSPWAWVWLCSWREDGRLHKCPRALTVGVLHNCRVREGSISPFVGRGITKGCGPVSSPSSNSRPPVPGGWLSGASGHTVCTLVRAFWRRWGQLVIPILLLPSCGRLLLLDDSSLFPYSSPAVNSWAGSWAAAEA